MRILWHSAAPWEGTGYGTQTAIWTQVLAGAGHEVAISLYHGLQGDPAGDWMGMRVYPAPLTNDAAAWTFRGNIEDFKPDLVIALCDFWRMSPKIFSDYKTLAWLPSDVTPLDIGGTLRLAIGDLGFLHEGQVRPIAMSRHTQGLLKQEGLTAPYVPHGIDTGIFRPAGNRDQLRGQLGLGPATFAVGINAGNIDPFRKALPEQLLAFARFHGKHPDSVLFLHTMERVDGSLDLWQVLKLGLGLDFPVVRMADQWRLQTGGFDQAHMARWYSCMDVVMNATRGEGFGLPAIEAQACGTPVILARNSTGPELAGPGWLVNCEPWWDITHCAWRATPSVKGLEEALGKAHAAMGKPFKREACRLFAQEFDVDKVAPLWLQVISDA